MLLKEAILMQRNWSLNSHQKHTHVRQQYKSGFNLDVSINRPTHVSKSAYIVLRACSKGRGLGQKVHGVCISKEFRILYQCGYMTFISTTPPCFKEVGRPGLLGFGIAWPPTWGHSNSIEDVTNTYVTEFEDLKTWIWTKHVWFSTWSKREIVCNVFLSQLSQEVKLSFSPNLSPLLFIWQLFLHFLRQTLKTQRVTD